MSNSPIPPRDESSSRDGVPPELEVLLQADHSEATRNELIRLWNMLPEGNERHVLILTALQMTSVSKTLDGHVKTLADSLRSKDQEPERGGTSKADRLCEALGRAESMREKFEQASARLHKQCHAMGSRAERTWKLHTRLLLPTMLLFDGWMTYEAFNPAGTALLTTRATGYLLLIGAVITGASLQAAATSFQVCSAMTSLTASARGPLPPVQNVPQKPS